MANNLKSNEGPTAVDEGVERVQTVFAEIFDDDSVLDLEEQRMILLQLRDDIDTRLDEVTDEIIAELSGVPIDDADDADDDADSDDAEDDAEDDVEEGGR